MVNKQGKDKLTMQNVMTLHFCGPILSAEVMY